MVPERLRNTVIHYSKILVNIMATLCSYWQ